MKIRESDHLFYTHTVWDCDEHVGWIRRWSSRSWEVRPSRYRRSTWWIGRLFKTRKAAMLALTGVGR